MTFRFIHSAEQARSNARLYENEHRPAPITLILHDSAVERLPEIRVALGDHSKTERTIDGRYQWYLC